MGQRNSEEGGDWRGRLSRSGRLVWRWRLVRRVWWWPFLGRSSSRKPCYNWHHLLVSSADQRKRIICLRLQLNTVSTTRVQEHVHAFIDVFFGAKQPASSGSGGASASTVRERKGDQKMGNGLELACAYCDERLSSRCHTTEPN